MPFLLRLPFIGVLFSLLSVLLGLYTGILIKKLGADVTLVTTLFYRFLLSLPFLLAFAFYSRGLDLLLIRRKWTMAFRVFIGFGGAVFWFLAMRNLPLGQAISLSQSSVIFVTLLSPFLLGERVGVYRWGAVAFGFCGLVIIANPFSETLSFQIIYGVLAALCSALLSISLRRLGKSDHPASVALLYNFCGTLIMGLIVVLFPSQHDIPHVGVWIDLALLGTVTGVAQIFLTSAYHYADAVTVASMRYVQIPLSGVLGYVLFTEIMTGAEIIGATIIVLSCCVIAWREFTYKSSTNG